MGPDTSGDELERGRAAYATLAWEAAYESLARADELEPLGAADLELLATSAYMLGREDEWLRLMERACRRQIFRDWAAFKAPGRLFINTVPATVRDPSFLGRGVIDFKSIFAKAPKGAIKHYFVEQDTCPGSPFDSIKVSFDYLKQLEF